MGKNNSPIFQPLKNITICQCHGTFCNSLALKTGEEKTFVWCCLITNRKACGGGFEFIKLKYEKELIISAKHADK